MKKARSTPPSDVRRRSMLPLRITSSHAVVSSSIESMARERAWAWHETPKQLNQTRHRAIRPCPGQQSSSKMVTNSCSSCGTVILGKNLWPVFVAVWVFDDRDTLRGTRHIIGSPHTTFREKTTRDTVHNVCSVFCWAPHGPFSLDARRLPPDQPPHLQHQSVESRKPNWCER